MKPELIRPPQSKQETVRIQKIQDSYFKYPWHYHPEMELTIILKGEGTRLVGDSMEKFQAGDVVLLGSNLPHVWQSHSKQVEDPTSGVEAIVIHFEENFYGAAFGELPEMEFLQKVNFRSKRGVQMMSNDQEKIIGLCKKMIEEPPFQKTMTMIEMLKLFDKGETHLLSSQDFVELYSNRKNHRFNAVYDYLISHFHERVRLEDVASQASLSPTSFCRFFKNQTGKSFSQFLKEIRIQYASRLLVSTDETVRSIAFQSGYNNLSNFNQHFREINDITPYGYRKTMI